VKKRNSLLLLDSNSLHRLTCLARTVIIAWLEETEKDWDWDVADMPSHQQ